MSVYTVRGITRVTAVTQLPVHVIRYWTELYGTVIGAERLPDGEWTFTAEALQFFTTLATDRMTAASRDELETVVPVRNHAETALPPAIESTPSPDIVSAPDARAYVEKNPHSETAAVTAQLNTLTARTEHLSLHIEDLAEETKQLQVLLTRIIDLLTPRSSHGAREKTVRAWHPPRL